MKQTLQLIAVLITLTLASCQTRNRQNANEPRTLVVTIEPLRYFTEQIAGEQFKVVSIVPEGSSPETYDPTPRQLLDIAKSEAWLKIGYIGFEQTWTDKLTANAPQMKVFDTSEGIELIRDTHHHEGHVHVGGVEPHTWTSPANARIIARNICNALCRIDSANTNYYTERLGRMDSLICRTDSILRAMLAQNADKAFLIYHPSLSYYARDYGMEQLCLEENGREPSPAHMRKIIEQCRQKGIRTIFIQKEFDSRNATLAAQETGTKLVLINPLAYEWEQELINITKNLVHE